MGYLFRRQTDEEFLAEHRWDQLATYNSEVSRGLVHTPEWDAKMAAEQEAWRLDQQHRWNMPRRRQVDPMSTVQRDERLDRIVEGK